MADDRRPDVEGDFARYPFPRLLFFLTKKRFTGELAVTRSSAETARVYFRSGLPVFSDLKTSEDILGQVLLERGWIDSVAFNKSLEMLAQGGKLQGQILIELGALTEQGLIDGLNAQLRRKLNRMFFWREEPFKLFAGEHAYGKEGEGAKVGADPLAVIYHGVRNAFDIGRLQPELDKLEHSSVQVRPQFDELKRRYGMGDDELALVTLLERGSLPMPRALQVSNLGPVETLMLIYTLWVTEMLVVVGTHDETSVPAAERMPAATQAAAVETPRTTPAGAPVPTRDVPAPTPAVIAPPPVAEQPAPMITPPPPTGDVPAVGQALITPPAAEQPAPMITPPPAAEQPAPMITPPPPTGDVPAVGQAVITPPPTAEQPAPMIAPPPVAEQPAPMITPPPPTGDFPAVGQAVITPPPTAEQPAPMITPPPVYGRASRTAPTGEVPVITPPATTANTAAQIDNQTADLPVMGGNPSESKPSSSAPAAANRVRVTKPKPIAEQAEQKRQAVLAKHQSMAEENHFELLGVERSASTDAIRNAYFALAKEFHPDGTAAMGISDVREQAEEIFRRINEAHTVLTDSNSRKEYEEKLDLGDGAEEEVRQILEAEFAFQRGTVLFRKKQFNEAREAFQEAARLNPDEGEHIAWIAWTIFSDPKSDRERLLPELKQDLLAAVNVSPKSPTCHYYLGAIYLALKEERRALTCFNKVLELKPSHVDAKRQVRLINMRQDKGAASESKSSGGLFGRLRKK